MIFIPTEKTTNGSACDAIQQYRESRPLPPNKTYDAVSLSLFILSVILWGSSIFLFIVFRNRERLRVVRPLFLNLILCVSQLIFVIGLTLNLVTSIRCGALLFCILLGFFGVGVNYFVRLLVFVIESQFALSMAEQHRQQQYANVDDKVSVATSHQSRTLTLLSSGISTMTSLFTVFRLALGIKSIRDVTFSELFKTTHSFGLVSITVFIPSFLITCGILIAEKTYYSGCFGCSIFLEVMIGFGLTLAIYFVLSVRILYVAWKLTFTDNQAVFREFILVVIVVGPVMVVGTVLLVLDPGSVGYKRIFAYEWIIHFGTFMYWYISAGTQFRAILMKASPRPDLPKQVTVNEDYIGRMHTDHTLLDAFERFAISRYCAENLYFVNDVLSYKRFFFEKSPNWRKQKAKFLFETYIQLGSVMEVNISQQVKMNIVQEIESKLNADDTQLVSVFDKAREDITRNVLKAVWEDFILQETTQPSFSIEKSSFGCCLFPSPKETLVLHMDLTAYRSSGRPKTMSNLSSAVAVVSQGSSVL